ncbi:histidinol-phosphate transaminase [Pichia californica]|uniref:histidinol-phosphate transaminase n=1 Tax=Pichia californica TaxID=460514 RepID=A0A9P6WI79_9ASCO|nr:histidinol-phosphate transaminase [[Candida] californica]
MTFDITKLARPQILTLEPYRCARDDFKEGILLDANENTHGPSFIEMTEAEKDLDLNRYPDPHQQELKSQIINFRNKERTDISETEKLKIANLCLGVGSDESIDALMRDFIVPSKEKMIICPPTYGMYSICAVVNDVEIVKVPLDLETFDIIPKDILAALKKDPLIKLVYITSPGNPTGKKIDEGLLLELLKGIEENDSINALVVLDEAYIDFAPTGSSLCTYVNKHPNLVVLQTLSKAFALAGIRLGITYATPEVSILLNSTKYPYNISNLTSDVAIRATKEASLIETKNKINKIIEQRGIVLEKLLKLKYIGKNRGGLDSNFILIEILNKDLKPDNEIANKVYLTLANEKKIIVRFRGKELGCTGCLRVSIGTAEENAVLVEQFDNVLNKIVEAN